MLDKSQVESHHMWKRSYIAPNRTPALITTKGSFAGIGASGSYRETGELFRGSE